MEIQQLIEHDELINYLPHKGKMFLLSRVTQHDVNMDQLRNGYAERVKEINEGKIETADNVPIIDIKYAQTPNVYPLEDNGRKREPRKEENIYSDYKCFTI